MEATSAQYDGYTPYILTECSESEITIITSEVQYERLHYIGSASSVDRYSGIDVVVAASTAV